MHTTCHYKKSPAKQKKAPARPKKNVPLAPWPPKAHPPLLLRTRLGPAQLLGCFRKLLPAWHLTHWLALCPQSFYERAFTPLVTLWYLVFQRLSANHHLSHVQDDALEGGADHLSPKGKPLSERLRSICTGTYSDARKRLPLSVVCQTLWHIAQQTDQCFQPPLWFGLKAALLDGSTFRLRPFGDIPAEFPPHPGGKSKKPPYWCVARVVGVLSLATGVALDTALGGLKASEQALCAGIFKARSWAGWVVVGDRNFGVYSVARSIAAAGGHVLVRLTQARAAKLARCAGITLQPGLDARFHWTPTANDQCPQGLSPDPLPGRLLALRLERPGYRPVMLYLFTTLLDSSECPAQQLTQLYGRRWNVEIDFRYIKTQMDLDFLEAHSTEIARKEWWAGLIAYNLIRFAMAAAGARAEVPLSRLSFCRTRDLLLRWLTRQPAQRALGTWTRLLEHIAKAQQPKRTKPLASQPRAVRRYTKTSAALYGSRAAALQKHAAALSKTE